MTHVISRTILLLAILLSTLCINAQIPEGFEIVEIATGEEPPMGSAFISEDLFYIWNCKGIVWAFENEVMMSEPVLDISEEVGCWGDNGMLGFALDPDFEENGHFYLLYQVDTYHLLNADSADYDPNLSQDYNASIARLTRYTVNTADYLSIIPDSRHVLIGDQIDNGIPVLTSSHSSGSIVFGSDGTLLFSCGDGSTWWGAFNGGPPYPNYSFDSLALELGILKPEENIGSFRAQYVDTYNGKVHRIDPETGLGIPSNPYYDASIPDSPRSKLWALGLRNPFRMTLEPFTGASNPEVGDPGTIVIGDVGFYTWDEIHVCDAPGLNFGWPIYEGMGGSGDYFDLLTDHPDYPNPYYDGTECTIENYRFQDLIEQENATHDYHWGNPCDAIVPIDSVLRFVHQRPVLAYKHVNPAGPATVLRGFAEDGSATSLLLTDVLPDADPFTGSASIGGDFYSGFGFPDEYFGAYFQSDYSGWTRVFWFDEDHNIENIEYFGSDLGLVVHTEYNPFDQCMYFSNVAPGALKKLCFTGNVRPQAIAVPDTLFGPSPMSVHLDGSASFDPDDDPITFDWSVDGVSISDEVEFDHVFTASSSAPELITVIFSVTDTAGNVGMDQVLVSLNNTPPVVDITSIEDGQLYSVGGAEILLDLAAEVTDQEHSIDQLDYRWKLILHHDTHTHTTKTVEESTGVVELEGIGCEEQAIYFYEVMLEVDDPAGLKGTDSVFLFPDCDGPEPPRVFSDFVVYPNPSKGSMSIRGPLKKGVDYRLVVSSLEGKIVVDRVARKSELGSIGVEVLGREGQMFILRLIGPDVNWSQRILLE